MTALQFFHLAAAFVGLGSYLYVCWLILSWARYSGVRITYLFVLPPLNMVAVYGQFIYEIIRSGELSFPTLIMSGPLLVGVWLALVIRQYYQDVKKEIDDE